MPHDLLKQWSVPLRAADTRSERLMEVLASLAWSTQHGDLRIAHFLGLHAVQVIPLAAFLLSRRRSFQSIRRRTFTIFTIAASYLSLIGILAWQALRGQSIVQPDGLTTAAFLVWLSATGIALTMCRFSFRQNGMFRAAVQV